jgi:hypothetical protein
MSGPFDFSNPENLEIMATDEGYRKWLGENLSTTKFKDIDEGVKLWQLCVELKRQMIKQNPELFDLIVKASIDQRVEILRPDRLTYDELGK